ncbi:MAG: hypothetical protein ACLPKB_28835 [Xanthobacteraceae bacterium]
MASAIDKVVHRFDELVKSFDGFVEKAQSKGGSIVLGEDEVWRSLISALQTIQVVCSESSPHYQSFKILVDSHMSGEPLNLRACIGILHAATDDLESGMLSDLGGLVAAEVFADLLSMASYLLKQGYHLPAAAISGAVLEDTLRQLCKKHKVSWTGDSSITKLNTELYKSRHFDKVQFGNIEAWGKLRNKVDHGDFKDPADVTVGDVKRMIEGVSDLIAASGLGQR